MLTLRRKLVWEAKRKWGTLWMAIAPDDFGEILDELDPMFGDKVASYDEALNVFIVGIKCIHGVTE